MEKGKVIMRVMIVGIGYADYKTSERLSNGSYRDKIYNGPVLHFVYPDGIVKGQKCDKKYISGVQGDYDYSPLAVQQIMTVYQSTDVKFPIEAELNFGRNDTLMSFEVIPKDIK